MRALFALALFALAPIGAPLPQGAPNAQGWELALAFRANVPGAITGVGYWRQPGENGPHVGRLWNADGTQAATVAFGDETEGWQWRDFPAPVRATAGTSWSASVNAAAGPRYSVDAGSTGNFTGGGPLSPLGWRFGVAEGLAPVWPSPNSYWRGARFLPDDGSGEIELSGDEETGIFARLSGFAPGAHDLTVTVDGVSATRKVTVR